jgi:hypothetical protein
MSTDKEREAIPIDPLEQAIDTYLDGYETIYDEGSYTPNAEEKFRIKDAIMGLLADPEWDRLWGEHVDSLVRAALASQEAQAPKREALTDEQIILATDTIDIDTPGCFIIVARTIERAHGIGTEPDQAAPQVEEPRCTCLTSQLGPDYCEVHAA